MDYEFDYSLAFLSVRKASSEFSEVSVNVSTLSSPSSLESIPSSRSPVSLDFPSKSTVSRPIVLNNDLDYVYRWDPRSPRDLRRSGFTGSNENWGGRIFGDRTIFASRNMDGAIAYFDFIKKYKCSIWRKNIPPV